jgi:retinol dehydrogenase 12
VTANCFHPGFIRSRFGDETGELLGFGVRLTKRFFAISPEQGAKTSVYLASAPEVAGVAGDYFYKCRPVQPSRAAQDDAMAQRLWTESARLARLET